MEKVKCVKCGSEVVIDLSKAVDSEGEVFKCPNCGQKFRYCHK